VATGNGLQELLLSFFNSRFNECLIFFPLNWIAVMVVVAFEDPFWADPRCKSD
jgi:hypothetical protein